MSPADTETGQAPVVRPVARTGPVPDPVVYQGWLGETSLKLTETSEADPVAVLATLMAFFGVMAGRGPYAQISDDRHPALLWPLILGHTGVGRKGTSLGVAARLVKAAMPEFASENITSGLSSGEGLVAAVADEEDETSGGKARLVIETEYSVTMNRAGREGNTLSGVLRQAWDGDDLSTLTKVSLHATAPHIGILAHITPGEFRLRVNGADMAGGTYNRFLPIYSERSKEIPEGEGAPEDLVGNLALVLRELVKKARDVRKVPLTDAARAYWADVVYGALSGAQPTDGIVAQFTARATPYARRAAMLYALGDGAAEVDLKHLQAAYALIGYARNTAAFVLDTGTGDPRLDKILVALDTAGAQGLTRSQVSDLFSRKLNVPQLNDLLTRAEALPGVTRTQRRGNGRPTDLWTLHTPDQGAAK
ncbi:MAG TPA: DUF3987 domain-containing protein [Actinocrinis sp.]|uniref:DUF3987 domain-containing protein n=1 Tax=Actinocrinis sp. TaxID=1920516 RepID=UPI002DDD91B8|nr:DUF3987 domain-containing protein [Actinocrinis sp.]HEV2343588.1 DUF3987 domain-containing protein [Actinocrinis sp.]